jgi:integrase/recombinase XerC
MSEVLPFRVPERPAEPGPPAVVRINLYGALLADASNPNTERGRAQDVADLARFLGLAGPAEAADLLIAGTAGQANAIATGWRRHLLDRGLSPKTINRRLSTLRRLVKLARRLGLVDWAIDIDGLKAAPYTDTRGPSLDEVRRLLAAATGDGPKARRDRALVHLLYGNGLRRGSVVSIDVKDVDLDGARVAVVAKNRTEREWHGLNPGTVAALRDWLAARGEKPGPLFTNFHPSRTGGRLTGAGVREVCLALSRRAKLARPVKPHGLRHSAVTRALELTGGNIRMVQRFSRHASADTVQIYDDNRTDLGGRVAELLGRDL